MQVGYGRGLHRHNERVPVAGRGCALRKARRNEEGEKEDEDEGLRDLCVG